MNKRLEAAKDGLMRAWQTQEQRATNVLTAVDAVTFSDEAVEHAAKELNSEHLPDWDKLPEWVKDGWREEVRAVIAALKDASNV